LVNNSNRTTKIKVWLQFSSILSIDEFKFLRINSPSLFYPILSKLSIKSLVRSYSTRLLTCW